MNFKVYIIVPVPAIIKDINFSHLQQQPHGERSARYNKIIVSCHPTQQMSEHQCGGAGPCRLRQNLIVPYIERGDFNCQFGQESTIPREGYNSRFGFFCLFHKGTHPTLTITKVAIPAVYTRRLSRSCISDKDDYRWCADYRHNVFDSRCDKGNSGADG